MDKGAVFAERLIETLDDFSKQPVFEKTNANWVDELVSMMKNFNYSVHKSYKMTPKQASGKSNEKEVLHLVEHQRRKQKP